MNNNRFINSYDKLNDDVLDIIKSHLKPEILVWLNKENYFKYHKCVKNMINKEKYDDYVRDIVKHDCSFVFEQIMNEHFLKFHKWKFYTYKNTRFHSYLIFLRYYAYSNNSHKCVEVIDDFTSQKGFSPNWYKYRGIIIRNNNN